MTKDLYCACILSVYSSEKDKTKIGKVNITQIK